MESKNSLNGGEKRHYRWLLLLLCFYAVQASGHALEKISVTSIKHSEGSLIVKIKIFTEDLQPQLSGLHPEKKFNHYLRHPFDVDIQKPVERFVLSQFQLFGNNEILAPQFQSLDWVEELKFTDHAMVLVTLRYNWSKNTKDLKITNSILIKNVYEQKNIVNVAIKNLKESYIFNKGNESIIINF